MAVDEAERGKQRGAVGEERRGSDHVARPRPRQRHLHHVRDPAGLIDDIAQRVPLRLGTAHLALVEDVSTQQKVLRVDTLRLPAEVLGHEPPREELRRVVDGWRARRLAGAP